MKENDVSLMKEINTEIVQGPLFKTEEDQQFDQNITMNSVAYDQYELFTLAESIKEQQIKKGNQPSPEMRAILEEIDGMEDLMANLPFEKDKPQDFLSMADAIADRLKKLGPKCDHYLSVKKPRSGYGKARHRLVTQIAKRAERDLQSFREKATDLLALPEEESKRVRTWGEFFNWERVLVIKDGENDVKVSSAESGNTSEVMVIEKADKKMFFKKEEKTGRDNPAALFLEKEAEYKKSVGKTKKGSTESYLKEFMKSFKETIIWNGNVNSRILSADKQVKEAGAKGYEAVKEFCRVLGVPGFFGALWYFLEGVDKIKDEKKKEEVQKAIGDFYTSYVKEAFSNHIAAGTPCIGKGMELAKRNVATSRLAKLLGISTVVPNCEMASVEANGKKTYGVIMEEAKGKPAVNWEYGASTKNAGKKLSYSDDALRDLTNLQILDALCGQTDRHLLNRMYDVDDSGEECVVKKVTGIDSDMSFGKLNYKSIQSGWGNDKKYMVPPVESKNGLFIPGMSKELADSILALPESFLRYEMQGLLSDLEIDYLCDRLVGIQEAIKRQMEFEKTSKEHTKFITNDKWGEFKAMLAERAAKEESFAKYLKKSYISPELLGGKVISKPKEKEEE